jgi:hypothetical protein
MHAIFLQAPPSECRHDTDRELTYRKWIGTWVGG